MNKTTKQKKPVFEMSRKEVVVQYTKIIMGFYALVILTIIMLKL